MLERIPSAKAALLSPARPETKAAIVAAIKAQRPLLTDIRADPNIIISKLTNIDAALLDQARSNPEDGYHFVLFQILSGKINEKELIGRKLSFPIPVPEDVTVLAREVGAIWDGKGQEIDWTKIPGAFADPFTEMSALFSLRHDSKVSLGFLLAAAEDKSRAKEMQYLKVLFSFMNGELDLDGLKEYYRKRGLELTDAVALKDEDTVNLKIGETLGQVQRIERRLTDFQEILARSYELVAKRMSVGFSPLL